MNYIALRVDCDPCSADITDLVADALAPLGYESFEADDRGLTAYVPENKFSEDDVRGALDDFPIPTSFTLYHSEIETQDWNKEWEQNEFKPILIGGECLIHSTRHTDLPEARICVEINPRMTFGTGHHFTTSLIVRRLLGTDLRGKYVIDMGTGTGILAILALKLGASSATGIEIDRMAFENARGNGWLNRSLACFIHGDASALDGLAPADIFIANINRNILLADMARYAAALKPGGTMLLSGFYRRDVPMLAEEAAKHGLSVQDTESDNDWTLLTLQKINPC